jgi:hypothetical protein
MVKMPKTLPGGYFYEIHAHWVEKHAVDDERLRCAYMLEVAICIMNNILHEAINNRLGGRQHLFLEMGHKEFLGALSLIRVVLRHALEQVQPRIQGALQCSFNDNWQPFRSLISECYDYGHIDMWSAYDSRKRRRRN